MADPQQERTSLDDLFRKTFENLPDTPAPSGWDAPSERVWQHVQSQVKPPKAGWSLQSLSLMIAFALVIAVGLYLLTQRKSTQSPPATTPAPVEIPATSAPAPTTPVATPETAQPTTTAKPGPSTKPAATRPATSSTQPASDTPVQQEHKRPTAAPLPGSRPASPNSTEREKIRSQQEEKGN